jgi:hypothetical protein
MILLPISLLVTLQPPRALDAGLIGLSAALALLAIESGGLLLTALAIGAASTVLLAETRGSGQKPAPSWVAMAAASLALALAGSTVDLTGGTSQYAAIPVASLTVQVFLLVAAAAVLLVVVVPAWTWSRSAEAAGWTPAAIATAILAPVGFYVLVRMYLVGDGRWPAPWLNLALAGIGTAIALGAALRAQAATSRAGNLAHVVPGLAGFSIVGLALGTPLGVTAGVATAAAVALLAGLLPLLPGRTSRWSAFALAMAIGVPPSMTFLVRLLDMQAALEAGEATAFLGLGCGVAWVISLAAGARSLRLPAAEAAGSELRAGAIAAIVLAGGVSLAAAVVWLAGPAAAEALASQPGGAGGGASAIVTRSGALAVIAIGLPLAVLMGLGLVLGGRLDLGDIRQTAITAPLVKVDWARLPRLRPGAGGAAVGALARRASMIERAAVAAPPLLWVAMFGVLALVLAR